MTETLKKDMDIEIKEALQINDADLPTELREQSTHLFYYGSLWARALRAERQQKLAVENLEATLSKEFRQLMLETEPGTRVTEKMLREFIAGHPAYLEANQKLIQAGFIADTFNVAKTAFESRGRMLLELSRQSGDSKFYDQEYKNMRTEFELREDKKAKKRGRLRTNETKVVEEVDFNLEAE